MNDAKSIIESKEVTDIFIYAQKVDNYLIIKIINNN